jgi:hypothetical protein
VTPRLRKVRIDTRPYGATFRLRSRVLGVPAVLRVLTALALALCLFGCQSTAEPVKLLTGVDGCWAGGESSSGITGVLVRDPNSGTSINNSPIMWPVGFTGRRDGAEVEVLDAGGNVVATTGRTYHLSMGMVSGKAASTDIGGSFPAAANCGYPWDFIDCTAAAEATGLPVAPDGGFTAVGEGQLYCGVLHIGPEDALPWAKSTTLTCKDWKALRRHDQLTQAAHMLGTVIGFYLPGSGAPDHDLWGPFAAALTNLCGGGTDCTIENVFCDSDRVAEAAIRAYVTDADRYTPCCAP